MFRRLAQIIAAFLTGVVGVMFGVGGGIILIPVLLFTGVKTKKTVGTSLAIIMFITLSGTLQHFHMKTLEISQNNLYLMGAGVLGAVFGSIFLNLFKSKTITYLIIAYFYIMGIAMILNPLFINAEFLYEMPMETFWISGFIVAVISSALGIGGGAILTPILIYIFEVPAKESIGIAMPFMFVLSFTATMINIKNKFIDYTSFMLMMPFAVGGTIAAYIYLNKIDNLQIQLGIGVLLLLNAVSITTKYILKNP
ncbi:MAG: sulfite exporter TauE/SafE family protein [Pseudomonadota bacterium]